MLAAGNSAQQRGFSGTIGPEYNGRLTRVQLEGCRPANRFRTVSAY